MFSALGLFGMKITRETITRAIALADTFTVQHSEVIPSGVKTAWTALRAELIAWKETL
jgi:hypothetical protein